MKLLWKSKKRLLTYIMLISMISAVFLPVVASAQESSSSENQGEIKLADENLEGNDSSESYLFAETSINDIVSDEQDLNFINDIVVNNVDGELFIFFSNNKTVYDINVETYNSNHEIADITNKREGFKFFDLNQDSKIKLKIKNLSTNTYYEISITLLSKELKNLSSDISIKLNSHVEVNVNNEKAAEIETNTETDAETETITEANVDTNIEEDIETTKTNENITVQKSRVIENKSKQIIYDEFLTKKNVDYNAVVLPDNEGIYTKPYGMEGSILYTSYKYNNKEVKVGEEGTTQSGTFVKLVDINTKATLGWINKNNIQLETYDEFLTKKNVNYNAIVLSNNEGIYTKPYGMEGSILYTTYKYNNREVRVGEEATTESGTFVKLIDIDTKATLGWIKKNDIKLKIYDEFLTKKNVNYNAVVLANNEGIYTKPYGMEGAILYTSYKYNNKEVRVGEEATTQSGTFVKLIDVNTKATLGWIKKNNIKVYDSFLTKHSVNYTAKVLPNNNGIYTKPYGMQGSVLYTSYKYNNKEVKVGEEATTQSGTFVKLVDLTTKATLGWINKNDISTKKVIFLDAGHGGYESGASYYFTQEKDLNLSVAKKIQSRLEKMDYIVVMSRTGDQKLSLIDRAQMANDAGVDIFVSVHHNAMPRDTQTTGIETYYYEYNSNYPPQINEEMHNDPERLLKSANLASSIHQSLIQNTGANNRGVRRRTFAVLRETSMPAVLLELGFMSSPSELANLKTDAYQNKLADSVAEGINKYFK